MILALTSWTAGGYGSGPQRTQQRSEFSLQIGEDQVNTSVAICLNHLNRLNWICSAADLNLKSTLIQSNPIQTNYSNQISSNQFNPIHSKSFNLINSSISPIWFWPNRATTGAFFYTSLRTTRGRSSTWGPEDGETWRCPMGNVGF